MKYNFKKILLTMLWVILGAASIILLAASIRKNNHKICKGVDISITGATDNFFIDKKDIQQQIEKYVGGEIVNRPISEFDLKAIEEKLKSVLWISGAELFFDNSGILRASIEEREPVARIFTSDGDSFYIDSTLKMLPVNMNRAARLPVFTNFPGGAGVLSRPDSNLIKDIKNLSIYIQRDSFFMAMIDQVAIDHQRQFEMVPKIGDQTILFGDARQMEDKFQKLRLFYKKVLPGGNLNKYSVINLQFSGQVVAKIKGIEDVIADSLRTIQYINALAAYSSKMAGDTSRNISNGNEQDSTDITGILQAVQLDDNEFEPGSGTAAAVKTPEPVKKTPVAPAPKKVVAPKAVTQPKTPVQKPIKTLPVKNNPKIVHAAKNEKVSPPKAVKNKKTSVNEYR